MAGCAVAILGLILAAAPPPAEAPERAAALARDEQAPSAELLLYLAEFVDTDGQAVDPTEFESASPEPQRAAA